MVVQPDLCLTWSETPKTVFYAALFFCLTAFQGLFHSCLVFRVSRHKEANLIIAILGLETRFYYMGSKELSRAGHSLYLPGSSWPHQAGTFVRPGPGLECTTTILDGRHSNQYYLGSKNRFSHDEAHLSRIMRKSTFCICKNKDADQLRGNREADQRLCFCYTDSTIPLFSKSEI